jgi:hypothetical protein
LHPFFEGLSFTAGVKQLCPLNLQRLTVNISSQFEGDIAAKFDRKSFPITVQAGFSKPLSFNNLWIV